MGNTTHKSQIFFVIEGLEKDKLFSMGQLFLSETPKMKILRRCSHRLALLFSFLVTKFFYLDFTVVAVKLSAVLLQDLTANGMCALVFRIRFLLITTLRVSALVWFPVAVAMILYTKILLRFTDRIIVTHTLKT